MKREYILLLKDASLKVALHQKWKIVVRIYDEIVKRHPGKVTSANVFIFDLIKKDKPTNVPLVKQIQELENEVLKNTKIIDDAIKNNSLLEENFKTKNLKKELEKTFFKHLHSKKDNKPNINIIITEIKKQDFSLEKDKAFFNICEKFLDDSFNYFVKLVINGYINRIVLNYSSNTNPIMDLIDELVNVNCQNLEANFSFKKTLGRNETKKLDKNANFKPYQEEIDTLQKEIKLLVQNAKHEEIIKIINKLIEHNKIINMTQIIDEKLKSIYRLEQLEIGTTKYMIEKIDYMNLLKVEQKYIIYTNCLKLLKLKIGGQ